MFTNSTTAAGYASDYKLIISDMAVLLMAVYIRVKHKAGISIMSTVLNSIKANPIN